MIFRDGTPEDQLDDFAHRAQQERNLGNRGNWFFSFRMGLQGTRSRIVGLERHRRSIYEWEGTHCADLQLFEKSHRAM